MHLILVTLLLIALALDVFLLYFASTRQDHSKSIYFSVLTAALFTYSLGYLLEIMCSTPEAATVALRIENFGIPLIAPFFLMTTISLYYRHWLRPWMLPAGSCYGILMFILVLFNERHGLYYTSLDMVRSGSNYLVTLGHGPLYFMQQAISISLMVFAYCLLLARYVRGNRKLRRQMTKIIFGSLIGFAANLLNASGILPGGVDPTPFALTAGLLLFAVDVVRYRIMDIVSLSSNLAVETMDDSMIVLDNDWSFLLCNQSATQLFPALASFQGTEAVCSADGWPQELTQRQEAGQVNFIRCGADGALSTYRAHISRILIERGRQQIGWSIVIRNITDMTRLLKQLEDLATTDALTGILNRREFMASAAREMEEAVRSGAFLELIMWDLDHFKCVNDTYGHAAGDFVLRAVVDAVKRQLRSYDLFSRFGGEEFLVLVKHTQKGESPLLATRLRLTIEQQIIEYENEKIEVTASFGVVKIHPGMDFEAAMRLVDRALYRSKLNGRNRVSVAEQ